MIAKLVKQPFTRQAQMITWMPNIDLDCYDPPCLQSIWYRLLEDEADGTWWLNCNIRFRSNDAWGASFMNMFGFILFNRDVIAAEIARRSGRTVQLGRLNWQADSYHIYGKDIADAKARLFDRLATTTFEDRVYRVLRRDDPGNLSGSRSRRAPQDRGIRPHALSDQRIILGPRAEVAQQPGAEAGHHRGGGGEHARILPDR